MSMSANMSQNMSDNWRGGGEETKFIFEWECSAPPKLPPTFKSEVRLEIHEKLSSRHLEASFEGNLVTALSLNQ